MYRFVNVLALVLGIALAPLLHAQNTVPGDLSLLVRAWGVLKYHHPRVTQCQVDWDSAFLDALTTLETNTTTQPLAAALQQLLDTANDGSVNITPATIPHWLRDGRIPATVQQDLAGLLASEVTQQCYVRVDSNSGAAVFDQDSAFSGALNAERDRGLRLLAAARLWNAVDYFYAYRDNLSGAGQGQNVPTDMWAQALDSHLPAIAAATDNTAYTLAIRRLSAAALDSQGELLNSEFALYVGTAPPPFTVRSVQGRLIVARVLPQAAPVQTGDEVISVNGDNVADLRARFAGLAHGANPIYRERVLSQYILNNLPTSGQALVNYGFRRSDGSEYRADLPLSEVFSQQLSAGDGPAWRLETVDQACTFGVLDLPRIEPNQLDQAFDAVRESDGLIVDLRGTLSVDATRLADLLYAQAPQLAQRQIPDLQHPGTFTDISLALEPQRHVDYSGRVIVLSDERTLDRAELAAMALQAYDNTTVLGSHSGATVGAVSRLTLPGDIELFLTTTGVRYPDERAVHQFGVVPDIQVYPDRSALAANRDELMASALNCDQLQQTPTPRTAQAGIYWNPQRDGEGFEAFALPGGRTGFLQYAFDSAGQPDWVLGQLAQTPGTAIAVRRFHRGLDGQTLFVTLPGSVRVDFQRGPYDPLCAITDQSAIAQRGSFRWSLDDESGAYCLQPLLPGSAISGRFSGAWSPPDDDRGWGLSVYELDDQVAVSLYLQDLTSRPRWLLGSVARPAGSDNTLTVTVPVRLYHGYCRHCPPETVSQQAAGTVTLNLVEPSQDITAGNTISINVQTTQEPMISWQRQDLPVRLLSQPR